MPRPGSRLRAFVASWCDDHTMTLVVDPAIADLQREPTLATYAGVLKVLALCAVRETIMIGSKWSADERKTLAATVAWSAAVISALVALLLIASNRFIVTAPVRPGPIRYLYMMPAAFGIALIFGIALGFVAAPRGRPLSRRVAATVLVLSVAASAATFVNIGWLTPKANQAFRVLVSGSPDIEPGINELSWKELAEKIDSFSDPAFSQFGYLHALNFNFHVRLAMTFAPIVFTLFALAIGGTVINRWVQLICAILACVLYWIALNARPLMPWNSGLPAFVAAWIGNFALLAIAAAAFVSARLRPGRRVQAAS